jgi:NADPH:quinone reductase-like Zn-dependent oxidoreductase
MRAAVVVGAFGLENLQVIDVEPPKPGPAEVLLRVRAASLNYRDLMVADGSYNPRYPLPLTLGSDAVGEVVELGSDCADAGVAVGDRVCALVAQGWLDGPPTSSTNRQTLGGPLPGVFAEFALARADSVIRVPPYLTDVEAATLPCAALTAWSALQVLAQLTAGHCVLTLGSGGVSVFALQIAQLAGARVVATSRDPRKGERLLELGAAEVIDARTPNWGRKARSLSAEGMDHVIDVGGADTLAQSLGAVRPGGVISLIGVLGGKQASLDLLPIVMRNVRLQGVLVGHRRGFRELAAAFEAARVRPIIDSVYPLNDLGAALARLASGQHFGKVCLQLE